MCRVRIRVPEIFEGKGDKGADLTAYEVAKRSNGRIIGSTLYRLVRQNGRVKYFDGDLLDALCDVLQIEPGELLERETQKPKKPKKRKR